MAIVINGSGTVTGISVGGLPDGIVDAGTLATDSVTTVKIQSDAISGAEIADNAVGLEHIEADAVGTSELLDDAVDSAQIAAGAIDVAHMAIEGATVAGNAKRFTGQYDGRETSTITLTCPFEPKSSILLMGITNTNCASTGMSMKSNASSSLESVLVWNHATGGNQWTYTNSYCGTLGISSSAECYLSVTGWTSTTLTLTKSITGAGTRAAVRYMLMAYG